MNDFSASSIALPAFSPNGVIQAITGGVFYICIAFALFFSAATIYAVIRYGESKGLAFITSIVYGIIFLSLFGSGVYTLGLIK